MDQLQAIDIVRDEAQRLAGKDVIVEKVWHNADVIGCKLTRGKSFAYFGVRLDEATSQKRLRLIVQVRMNAAPFKR